MNQYQNIQSSFAKHSLEFSVKARKTPHQYPEFGPKPGEIKKKPAKKYSSLQGGGSNSRNAPLFRVIRIKSCD
jgi:hypothetical protein